MTTTIRSRTGLDLAAAKNCTDSVLEGKTVIVAVQTIRDAQKLVAELVSLGADAEVAD